MKRNFILVAVVCLAAASFSAWSIRSHRTRHSAGSSNAPEKISASRRAAALASYAQLPLTFEENAGQTDPAVKFLARGDGYTAFLTRDEAVLSLQRNAKGAEIAGSTLPGHSREQSNNGGAAVVRIGLKGVNPDSKIEAGQIQPGRSNYLIGNDPTRWRRDVPRYANVTYRDVYPKIDLIYHGNQKQLEEDFVLAPGADPNRIDLGIKGAEKLSLNPGGDLVVATKNGDLLLQRPTAYQETDGKKSLVAASFVLRNSHAVGVRVAAYDHSQTLIVDPVVGYATYLGGSSTNDFANAIAADGSGNAYITGIAGSADFPTTSGALITTQRNSQGNAFVTKLNSSGTALVFSTYLGGSGNNGGADTGTGIAVDSAGNVYVVGTTGSKDFPVTLTAFQTAITDTLYSAFLTKLAPNGSALLYSTFLGGNASDHGDALAIDTAGNMYISGSTDSSNFPITANAIQATKANPSSSSLFISRLDPTKSGAASLVYSTYFGGSNRDSANGIAVDTNSNVYIAGSTNSTDFPVKNAFQSALKGNNYNVFLARIDTNPATASLVYSTYLAGTTSVSTGINSPNVEDFGFGVAADNNFNAFVTGEAGTPDFPTTAGAFQSSPFGSKGSSFVPSAFASRFDTSQSGAASLIYSTLLGGSQRDSGDGITIDSLNNVYVTGLTNSTDFPITPGAPQTTNTTAIGCLFLSELNSTGTGLLFSTYFGQGLGDFGSALALDHTSPPSVYIVGSAEPSGIVATAGAFQTTDKASGPTPFVVKMSPGAAQGAQSVTLLPASLNFGTVNENTASPAQTVTLTNATASAISSIVISFTGANSADFGQTTTCGATLASGASCTVSVKFTPTTSASESATLQIADSDAASPHLVTLTGSGIVPGQPGFSLTLTPSQGTVTAGGTAAFSVTVTSINSFASPVSLTCSGAPVGSFCSVSPASVTPAANSTASTAVKITTTPGGITPIGALVIPAGRPLSPNFPIWLCTGLTLALAFFAARIVAQRAAKKLIWAFALLALAALAGCHAGAPGTPAGNYNFTLNGTSGSNSNSVTYVLTVN